VGRPADRPAEGPTRQLHPVADAQHRDAEVEDGRVAGRGAGLVHAGRPAGQDDPLRVQLADPGGRQVVPDHLAEDVQLPHPAGDQLPELGAEVEHQDELVGHVGYAGN
jgi:hypothetical protein